MARTAPVPNIPAIPGMNPGVFVMGGGGAGGGKGGKGGKGKGKGQGANGEGGGDGAEGGGAGAGNCGQGGAGGCTSCSSSTSAGDPVDVLSGEVFTLPQTDLSLPGPVRLTVLRSYSVQNRESDVGLGYGWSHTLAWRLTLTRREVIAHGPFGPPCAFDRKEAELGAFGDGAWILAKQPDGGYRLDTNDDFYHFFEPVDADGTRFRFKSLQHAGRTRATLEYDERGRLEKVVDFAGRSVRVATDAQGRITSLSISEPTTGYTITYARYQYDQHGNLISYTDADGATTQYWYDDDHKLTRYAYPNGLTFYFQYDDQSRCLETWGEYTHDKDPALDDDPPEPLADGTTKARGIYHTKFEWGEDYSEVIDSVRLLRFFRDPETNQIVKAIGADGGVTTRTFDTVGNTISHTNAEGATTSHEWNIRGRLLKEVDAEGNVWSFFRDDKGRIIQQIDPLGGVANCYRDECGNVTSVVDQRGAVTSYKFDDRSLITEKVDPNGGRTTYRSDAHGNMSELTFPDGTTWRWQWDYFGRVVSRTDPRGRTERLEYSPGGNVVACQLVDGRVIRYDYDSMGNCVAEIRPEGTTRFHWGGLRWPSGMTYPNGEEFQVRWNREGWPTKLVNERGEVCEWVYTPAGYVCEERMFDGSVIRVGYDLMGRHILWERGGERIEYTRDALGRVVEVAWPDDSTETFEYNACSELVAATGPDCTVQFDRDPCGNCVKETQAGHGQSHWVGLEYDNMNRLVQRETSLGHVERIERDVMGRRSRVELGEAVSVKILRDVMGSVTKRQLPGGASIDYEWDDRFRLTRMRLVSPSAALPKATRHEPDWIGKSRAPAIIDKAFQYNPCSDLTKAWDSESGTVTYDYDMRKRLLERAPEHGDVERFTVDSTGNHCEVPVGVPAAELFREYGPGNRLLRRGDARYVWDEAGFLQEKHVPDDDDGESIWRYQWNGQGQLASASKGDDLVVEFFYDPFGRRLGKRVLRRDETGNMMVEASRTRFVWSGDHIIHDIDERLGRDGTHERTYLYDDHLAYPVAHEAARRTNGEKVSSEWLYYVGDIIGTPEQLVTGDGDVAGTLKHNAYGITETVDGSRATTPMRFAGQYADEETGLHYNRYRYYDPEAGRYISIDPFGPEAGLNAFCYGLNPVGFVDPLGLARHRATVSVTTTQGDNPGTYTPDSSSGQRQGGPYGGGDQIPGMRSTMGHNVPGANRSGGGTGDAGGGLTQNRSSSYGHTEQNAIEWAERTLGPDRLRGSRMNLGGEFPPCPRCHRAMQEFAARNRSTVDYNYPVGNRVRYDGRNGPGPPGRAPATASGQQYNRDLIDRYNAAEQRGAQFGDSPVMANLRGQEREVGHPEGYRGGNTSTPMGAYRDASQQQRNQGHTGYRARQDHVAQGGDPHEPPPAAPH